MQCLQQGRTLKVTPMANACVANPGSTIATAVDEVTQFILVALWYIQHKHGDVVFVCFFHFSFRLAKFRPMQRWHVTSFQLSTILQCFFSITTSNDNNDVDDDKVELHSTYFDAAAAATVATAPGLCSWLCDSLHPSPTAAHSPRLFSSIRCCSFS